MPIVPEQRHQAKRPRVHGLQDAVVDLAHYRQHALPDVPDGGAATPGVVGEAGRPVRLAIGTQS
eukprot:4403405-Lingulodinium_polyedra.AAC.2